MCPSSTRSKKTFLPVEAVREACLTSGLSNSSAQSFKGEAEGEGGNLTQYKSVVEKISKPSFLAPEVQWVSKFTVFV